MISSFFLNNSVSILVITSKHLVIASGPFLIFLKNSAKSIKLTNKDISNKLLKYSGAKISGSIRCDLPFNNNPLDNKKIEIRYC